MPDPQSRLFIVTGGPGAGKTSLIEALRTSGVRTVPESGRAIIRQQSAIGGEALPWRNPALYAELMLSWELRAHAEAKESGEVVYCDRGIPDILGYLRLCELPVPDHLLTAIRQVTYNTRVFVCPSWSAIYRPDEERKQSFELAERTAAAMEEAYSGLGYEIVIVPPGPLDARRRFVADHSLPHRC